MSPTYEARPRALREYLRLPSERRVAFRAARRRLGAGLRESPPRFDAALRVKGVKGHAGVWELPWAPNGRATFGYGAEMREGEPKMVWRRIGDAGRSAPTRSSVPKYPGSHSFALEDNILTGIVTGNCFGCSRGGRIFDLASLLIGGPWGADLRGDAVQGRARRARAPPRRRDARAITDFATTTRAAQRQIARGTGVAAARCGFCPDAVVA